MPNKLKAMRCYLAGAMDRAPDGGVEWRKMMTPWLNRRGVIVLDPTDKPIDIGIEDLENREYRRSLKDSGQFDLIASEMRLIRCVDLRMVDLSDFLIVNIDVDIHTCGTYEEVTWANRQKKPIIVRIAQGKKACPDWLLGTVPPSYIFSMWEEVYEYLDFINCEGQHDKRWMFFRYKVPPEALG